jgi:hypothetical protein
MTVLRHSLGTQSQDILAPSARSFDGSEHIVEQHVEAPQCAVQPPSTGITAPVIEAAASEHRNVVKAAIFFAHFSRHEGVMEFLKTSCASPDFSA